MTKNESINDKAAPARLQVLGQHLDAVDYSEVIDTVVFWAKRCESRYVCVTNVHVVMEGWDNPAYREVINAADLITPDGVPLVWCLRAMGLKYASRVYGPDLTWRICERAVGERLSIALYGGTEDSLADFITALRVRYPGIDVACAISPPFRTLSSDEDRVYTEAIRSSGADILFVGIGCPKQERWMHEHLNQLAMPMLGVGAAFDFHSGRVRQAPSWMQGIGMEWFFRFLMEPRRLWRRYAWHNPRFVFFFMLQYLRFKFGAARVA
ncbi:MAG: N-acetylglucosaminyldiphosphoundecaprenol N-acetyl-beta-D-mannosaminyltransferase [Lentimonas sp.]|jgi:N-acetylglucosaminyldiphosphoundecaprenol N-acetyl-beta-D-mannosaminyltransferase